MLLNLFFDNINGNLEILLIGILLFAYYWFVLRKYNSLGFRLFSLCFFLFIACCTWLYRDEKKLKNIINAGEEHVATVLSKTRKEKNNNEVAISFTAKDNRTINATTTDYISDEEWDKFENGKPLSVIYVPATQQTFVQQSIMRFKGDKIYLYYFAGFWLMLGTVLYVWLRKLKVQVDENTGDEWVVKEDGSIILDERRSGFYRNSKHINIISKLTQVFGK